MFWDPNTTGVAAQLNLISRPTSKLARSLILIIYLFIFFIYLFFGEATQNCPWSTMTTQSSQNHTLICYQNLS